MTIRDWLLQEYADEPETIREIARLGSESGFGGLTNYSDCLAIYERCERDIWIVLNELAADLGHPNALAWLAQRQGDQSIWSDNQLRQAIVFAAVDAVAPILAKELPGADDEE